jgi:NADH-ubiquinone oxidoreductase chain 5
MAAPTPVSSLVHSSTLVTAGLFIFFRVSPNCRELLVNLLGIFGLFTLIIAGLGTIKEKDSKKLIAFSTMSQLGLMSIALYFGNRYVAFFHLLVHANFKALLFILCGFHLTNSRHLQDIREFSNRLQNSVALLLFARFSCTRLTGIYYTKGFYRKDLVLEVFGNTTNIVVYFVFITSLAITRFYAARLFFSFNNPANNKHNLIFNHRMCLRFVFIYSTLFLVTLKLFLGYTLVSTTTVLRLSRRILKSAVLLIVLRGLILNFGRYLFKSLIFPTLLFTRFYASTVVVETNVLIWRRWLFLVDKGWLSLFNLRVNLARVYFIPLTVVLSLFSVLYCF